MEQKVLDHYLQFGMFTYPGLYADYFKSLSDNVKEVGNVIRSNFIHRSTLADGNTGTNVDFKYGDMTKVPWYRQPEDDYLVTAVAIIAELFRRDPKGLHLERKVEDRVVLTCRFDALLLASILKTKGIPARLRAGFAGYFEGDTEGWDHWIVQYWSKEENRWINVDVDGSWHNTGFDLYDMPNDKFDWPADSWLGLRQGVKERTYFNNAGGYNGLITIAWQLFYDFHCLMNSEIIYLHHPSMITLQNFPKLSEEQLQEIDDLARLMQKPDENFDELVHIWNAKKEFRLLVGALL